MAKKINFTFEGKDYTLEFDRESVKRLEGIGFNIDAIDTKPATMIPLFFRGSFFKNHSNTKPKVIEEIFDSIGDREMLISTLVEMYVETLQSLIGDSDEKGVKWTVD